MAVDFEFSAGGVVTDDAENLVVLLVRNFAGDQRIVLPKGHIEEGETTLRAATREVTEETGFAVECLSPTPIKVIEYWYVRPSDKIKVKKSVSFFRFKVVGGDPDDHDDEVEEVLVIPITDALDRLSYPAERQVASEALGLG